MDDSLKELKDQIRDLSDNVVGIRISQGKTETNLDVMSKTMEEMTKTRAEIVHIMKSQGEAKKGFKVAFDRIRELEANRPGCEERFKAMEHRVFKLEKHHWWFICAIVSGIGIVILRKMVTV